jgi:hypothetical protein
MNMVENNVNTVAVFSDDNRHRTLLRKTWSEDESLKKGAILMIFPASNSIAVLDTTTMIVQNALANAGFKSVDILNIYSKIDGKPGQDSGGGNIAENDEQIRQTASEVDSLIIAWGTGGEGNSKVRTRQMQVLKILEPYKEKLMTTVDWRNKTAMHPLTPSLRKSFGITKFDFPDIHAATEEKESGEDSDTETAEADDEKNILPERGQGRRGKYQKKGNAGSQEGDNSQ